jgi:hypothetical protein
VSRLGPDDAHLHYEDGSHRWLPGNPAFDDLHRLALRVHIASHRDAFGHAPARRSPRDATGRATQPKPINGV